LLKHNYIKYLKYYLINFNYFFFLSLFFLFYLLLFPFFQSIKSIIKNLKFNKSSFLKLLSIMINLLIIEYNIKKGLISNLNTKLFFDLLEFKFESFIGLFFFIKELFEIFIIF
jgi:hypothetical protein